MNTKNSEGNNKAKENHSAEKNELYFIKREKLLRSQIKESQYIILRLNPIKQLVICVIWISEIMGLRLYYGTATTVFFPFFPLWIRRSVPVILWPFYYCILGLGVEGKKQISFIFRSHVLRPRWPTNRHHTWYIAPIIKTYLKDKILYLNQFQKWMKICRAFGEKK